MSPQYGKLSPLLAGLGHRSKFQRVLRLCFLLQRRRSAEANQTLHDVWPSPANFTLHPSLAFSYIGSITAWHSTSGRQPSFAVWYKEWKWKYGTFADGAVTILMHK